MRRAAYQPRQRAFIPISNRTKNPPAPKPNQFAPIIDNVLKEDVNAPRKQRATATQSFGARGTNTATAAATSRASFSYWRLITTAVRSSSCATGSVNSTTDS